MRTETPPRAAADRADTARRLLLSARTPDSAVMPVHRVAPWLAERTRAGDFRVTRVPFAELRGWSFEEGTGNLRHESGRFFSVEGLHVHADGLPVRGWKQPIIVQPEIGLLGIVAREIDGVLHFLMQAKMEPGNVNTLQLSPTVQATRSNFTGVHRGRGIPHLDLFLERGRARVLVDALQSEQADWFLGKRNRNMVVEIDEDIETGPEFRWLTYGQLLRLLRLDNVVNMDSRSILACLPTSGAGPEGPPPARCCAPSTIRRRPPYCAPRRSSAGSPGSAPSGSWSSAGCRWPRWPRTAGCVPPTRSATRADAASASWARTSPRATGRSPPGRSP